MITLYNFKFLKSIETVKKDLIKTTHSCIMKLMKQRRTANAKERMPAQTHRGTRLSRERNPLPGLLGDTQNRMADEYLMLVGLIIATAALTWVAVENKKIQAVEQEIEVCQ